MDEKQAIDRLLRLDPEGLAWLVERCQVKALRVAFLITRERALAEDVVQDKFARLPGTIRTFDRARPFEPWFLRGVVNAAIRAVSHRSRSISLADGEEAERWLDQFMAHAPGPEEQMQRAVIVMRYYLDMSEAEMAEAAAVPKGTIKWRLNAARARLQKLLSPDPRKEVK